MQILRAQNLTDNAAIAHGFFGRQGGVSQGIFTSLNCGVGSGDAREHVVENRGRIVAALAPGASLLTLHQVHSPKAITVDAPWEIGKGEQADAMVTNRPGLALGILTADCTPILFADAEARVIGAAHAGWKGALGGIIESTIAAMESLGAERGSIAVTTGPCISQQNYETGADFRASFLAANSQNARFFLPSNHADHFHFDLPSFAAARLAAAGIDNVERMDVCTYAREEEFYSFRRATHRGEKDYGRQISAIVLL